LRILGIDPGSVVTGYGVVETTRTSASMVHVCDGSIRLGGLKTMPEKLLAISRAISAVIEEQRPDAVAVESVFHAKNARSAIMLGHARGVTLLEAARHGLDVFEYPPSNVKQAVTGHGNSTKDQVGRMVALLLKCQVPDSADAADALAVAICHLNHARGAAGAAARGMFRVGRGARIIPR
jgi:crossover junction endodeoxyribonuclease RuvC